MELANEVFNSLDKYFCTLPYTGYKSDNEVNKLLVFTFIEELLYGPLSQYITEEDYTYIIDAMYCLYGSCLIPFPEYKKGYTPIISRMLDEFRVTNKEVLRNINNSELRVKS